MYIHAGTSGEIALQQKTFSYTERLKEEVGRIDMSHLQIATHILATLSVGECKKTKGFWCY